MKSKKAQAQANEATRKEDAAMERRQKQSQKSKDKAANAANDKEARLAATMAQQSVIAAEAAKDEAAQSANATEAARDRWRADACAQSPCQYADSNMVVPLGKQAECPEMRRL